MEAGPGCLDRRFLHGPYQGGSPSPIVTTETPGAIQFFRAERSAKRIATGKLIRVGHVNTNTPLTAHGAPETSLTVAEGQGWSLFVPHKKAWFSKSTFVKAKSLSTGERAPAGITHCLRPQQPAGQAVLCPAPRFSGRKYHGLPQDRTGQGVYLVLCHMILVHKV